MSTAMEIIPDNIGLNYVSCVSLKKKLKAQGFVSGSYFQKVAFYAKNDDVVEVAGYVFPSQRKNDKPHRAVLTINKSKQQVEESQCTCQIGLKADGPCSHGVAVLLLLEQWKMAGYKQVPAMLSCTSLPQQWDKPRGERIEPEPVSTMIIAKPSNTNRKRKPVITSFTDNRKIQVTNDDISSLQCLSGSPISYLVEHVSSSTVFSPTQYGDVPTGAALGYHAPLITPLHMPRQEKGCGSLNFPYTDTDNLSESTSQLLAANEHQWSHLCISQVNAHTLEHSTTSQASSKEWFAERSKRITASTFGPIMKRKKDINSSFLHNTFSKGQFHSKQTSYGIANESKAKMMFIKSSGAHLHEVGLIVNPKFPFIGATPDAIICKDGKSSIMEVKCPYSARDLTFTEAIDKIKDFFLTKDGNDIKLKQTHEHYFQVQGQLLVSGATECYFITYTRKDFHCEVIFPDKKIMNELLQKLVHIYCQHFKPFMSKE